MASIVEKFTKLIKDLLPLGRAWDNVREDTINIFPGMAVEYCRVKDRGTDLLNEIDPGTSTELLSDWETLLGLPDDCTPETTDIIERRTQARQKLASVGGLSASFYEKVASDLGFDAIVTDIQGFRVGVSTVGQRLTNPFDTNRHYLRVGNGQAGDPLLNGMWNFCFEVNVEATVVEPFKVGENAVGDPLVEFGNELLECTIAKLKPAHTCAFFTFRDP
jgi:uncharacterized protein YmfQ (DUF2313 family)